MIDNFKTLEDVVRDTYARVVWTHKIQEKQADIYAEQYKKMETINIVSSSLTSAGIIAIVFSDPLWLKLISAFISFASVYISAYLKSFNLQQLTILHKTTANKLIEIRDQYMILLMKIKIHKGSIEDLVLRYENLVEKTDSIYLEAPSTTDKAVDRASKALKIKKDNTFTDDEIDSFLPESLWRKNNEL